jgi:hypothetical protein
MADYVSPMVIAYVYVEYHGSEEVQDNNSDMTLRMKIGSWLMVKNLMMS